MSFPMGVRARVRLCASRRVSWGANMNEGVRRVSRLKVSAKDEKMKVMEEIEKADWLGLVVLHSALGDMEQKALELASEGLYTTDEVESLRSLTAKADKEIARRMVSMRGHVAWAHDAPERNNDLGPIIENAIWRMIASTAERLWEEGDFS